MRPKTSKSKSVPGVAVQPVVSPQALNYARAWKRDFQMQVKLLETGKHTEAIVHGTRAAAYAQDACEAILRANGELKHAEPKP